MAAAEPQASSSAPSLNRYFALILCLLLLAGLAAASSGWLLLLEQRSATLRESRYQFSLTNVSEQLESGLQLGLELADLPRAQQQIDETRIQERGIVSIDVFDPRGHIVFTTDDSGVGSNVPVTWRLPCLQASQPWHAQDEDGYLQCIALHNGYEQVAGGVLLRYNLSSRAGTFGVLSQRWPLGLGLLALLALLGTGFGWLLLRPLERQAAQAAAALDDAGDNTPAAVPLPALPAAMQALRRRRHELDAIEAAADRLDNLDVH